MKISVFCNAYFAKLGVLRPVFSLIARKGDISLAPWGEGVRRTGEGLLGNFLSRLGKNLWVTEELFVFLQQKQEVHSHLYFVSKYNKEYLL